MADQILRCRGRGKSPTQHVKLFEFRQKFNVLYFRFKPTHWYWIMIILWRKFMLAIVALFFRNNVVFQLAITLSVIFTCYALQMRHHPYLSSAEFKKTITEARVLHAKEQAELNRKLRKAASSGANATLVDFKTTYSDEIFVDARPDAKNKAATQMRLGDEKVDLVEQYEEAVVTLWNYNSVESVLLFCAVCVNLSGIMFESTANQTNSANIRNTLVILVTFVIIFSITYFFTVLITELLMILFPTKFKFKVGGTVLETLGAEQQQDGAEEVRDVEKLDFKMEGETSNMTRKKLESNQQLYNEQQRMISELRASLASLPGNVAI